MKKKLVSVVAGLVLAATLASASAAAAPMSTQSERSIILLGTTANYTPTRPATPEEGRYGYLVGLVEKSGEPFRAQAKFDLPGAEANRVARATITLPQPSLPGDWRSLPPAPELWLLDRCVADPGWSSSKWLKKISSESHGNPPQHTFDVSEAYFQARAVQGRSLCFGVKMPNETEKGSGRRMHPNMTLVLHNDNTGQPPHQPDWLRFNGAPADVPFSFTADMRGRKDITLHTKFTSPALTKEFVSGPERDENGDAIVTATLPEGEYEVTGWFTLNSNPLIKSEVSTPRKIRSEKAPTVSVKTSSERNIVTLDIQVSERASAVQIKAVGAHPWDFSEGVNVSLDPTTLTVKYELGFLEPGEHVIEVAAVGVATFPGIKVTAVTPAGAKPVEMLTLGEWDLNGSLESRGNPPMPLTSTGPQEWNRDGLVFPASGDATSPAFATKTSYMVTAGTVLSSEIGATTCSLVSVTDESGNADMGYGLKDGSPAFFVVDRGVVTWAKRDIPLGVPRWTAIARHPSWAAGQFEAIASGLTPIQGKRGVRLGSTTAAGEALPACTGSVQGVRLADGQL